MNEQLLKEAIAPSDVTNALRALRLAKDYSGLKAGQSLGRVGAFLRNMENSASRWDETLNNVDLGFIAVKDAGDEIKNFSNQAKGALSRLADSRPLTENIERSLRSLRNTALVGGGALATGLALQHLYKRHQEKKKRAEGGNILDFTKEAQQKNILKSVLSKAVEYGGPFLSQALPAFAISAGSVAAADLTRRALDRPSKKADKLWEKFIQRFPEYRDNALAREHFEVMVDFNPSAAQHPVVAKAYLDGTTYGDGMMGLDVVSNLARIESSRSGVDQFKSRQLADAIRMPLSDVARSMTAHSDAVLRERLEQARKKGQTEAGLAYRGGTQLDRRAQQMAMERQFIEIGKAMGEPRTPEEMEAFRAEIGGLNHFPYFDQGFLSLVEARAQEVAEYRRQQEQQKR